MGEKLEVYLDGGIRQGTDVLKALALGARAVFVGRPVLWGLACGGREGVMEVLNMLRDELSLAMQLAGKPVLCVVIATQCCRQAAGRREGRREGGEELFPSPNRAATT